MKRKIVAFLLSVVMAGVACCVLGGQPAHAEEPTTSETPESGNLTVVEQGSNGTQEFYQVQSKNGNTFYIIIDRTKNTENVYFLNQVDETDLMALIGSDDIQPSEKECICDSKCTVGNINTDCPVCAANMTECFGTAEQGQEQEQEQTKPEKTPSPDSADTSEGDFQNFQIPQQALYAIPVVIVVLFIVIAVVLKKRKSKKATAEDESDDEYVFEDDDEDGDADIEDK